MEQLPVGFHNGRKISVLLLTPHGQSWKFSGIIVEQHVIGHVRWLPSAGKLTGLGWGGAYPL